MSTLYDLMLRFLQFQSPEILLQVNLAAVLCFFVRNECQVTHFTTTLISALSSSLMVYIEGEIAVASGREDDIKGVIFLPI